jgi:hypothetical protein
VDIFFDAVHAPPKGVSKLKFDNGSDDLITACLEGPLDKERLDSLIFTLQQRKIIAGALSSE